jgi:hypothetical protein
MSVCRTCTTAPLDVRCAPGKSDGIVVRARLFGVVLVWQRLVTVEAVLNQLGEVIVAADAVVFGVVVGELAEAHDQFIVIVLRGVVTEPHVSRTLRVRLHVDRYL